MSKSLFYDLYFESLVRLNDLIETYGYIVGIIF